MQNSFMLVSSLLLLSRFDLIDGMLLLDSTWCGRDRTEYFVLKFVLIGLDLKESIECHQSLFVWPENCRSCRKQFRLMQVIFSDT